MVTMNRLVFVGMTIAAAACGSDSKSGDGDGGRIDARVGPDATPAPYCTAKPGTNLKLTPIVDGLELPVLVTAPAGDGRLFVVEQPGRIRIVKDGSLLPTPFLDVEAATASRPLAERIVNTGDEQGLLGLAFHPDFANNGRFFVHYTANGSDNFYSVVVAEYTAEPGADSAGTTEKTLLRVPHPYDNHNGGTVQFGADGFLYISIGDGGGANGAYAAAHEPESLLARILRIDVDGTEGGKNYRIPPSNPWASKGGAPEMFAWGLRNPWRFTIDHDTGNVFIGDVGQERYEEINVINIDAPGLHFGWPRCEGNRVFTESPTPIDPSACDNAGQGTTGALIAYDQRGEGNPCSVVGGPTYRGTCMPDLVGHTFFGDVCTGRIETFAYEAGRTPDVVDRSGSLGTVPLEGNLSSFGVDGYGELYVTRLGRSGVGSGTVFRIEVE
jgi:glucose/arabinose dehydrogenase